ncbi:Di-copper centre-containing protein, partial [Coemansia reversa NRRL 1564]
WDTTLDYEDPASSPILRDDTLGGNGQGPNSCLPNGVQGGWEIGFPNRHCLRREFNNGDSIEPWIPAEVISSYIQSDDNLSLFREHIEYGIHGAVHLGLGGDDSTRYAPVDLFFFMHHANIDRLWWLWQNNQHDPLDYSG